MSTPAAPQMPSRAGLLVRLLVAAVIGAVLVFCVILPAEYRIDPTGFGRLTGLLALTTPIVEKPAATPATAAEAGLLDSDVQAVVVGAAQDVSRTYPMAYRTDTVKIPLGPDGELEYKVKMMPGQTLIYSWAVDRGSVYFDFHGEPADPTKSQSYLEVQETKQSNGAFVAPFEGIHGWYWLNLTGEPLTITLQMAGFYELHGVIQ